MSVCVCVSAALTTSCSSDDDEDKVNEPETGAVIGTITDVSTGEGIPGAKVSIASDLLETTTGSNGSYSFGSVNVGTKQVSVTASGYNTSSKNVVVSKGNTATADIQLSLNSTAITLSPVSLNFGPTVSQLTFSIKNGTSSTQRYSISAFESFISVQPSASTIPANGTQTITVSIDRTDITSNVNTQLTVNVGSNSYSLSININASK